MTSTQDNWEATTAIGGPCALGFADGKRAQLVQLAGANIGAVYNLVGTLLIGRGSDADLRIEGIGISRHHARITQHNLGIEFEDLSSTNGSFVNGERVERRELCPGDKIQLGSGTILKFGYQDEIDADFQRLMFESTSRDMVTELCNGRFFRERLSAEFAFAVRHRTPLSLIAFAIDGFRALEESYGGVAGNRLLASLAADVLSIVRGEDVIAHCGRGEFAILSRGIDARSARAISERVRAHAENLRFEFEGQPIAVTICVGIASMPHAEIGTPDELLQRAELALGEAQSQGRGSLVLAD
jgi:diguanylate cyclase (GGDEF)-like protein